MIDYQMKTGLLIILVLTSSIVFAQDDDCMDRILSKEGQWVKLKETIRASPAEYAAQKKFSDAFLAMLSAYKPKGVQAQWSGGFSSVTNKRPVADYSNLLLALKYYCQGNELKLDHETNTTLDVRYNFVSFLEIYDTTADYYGAGYFDLREGYPVETKPGSWKFADARTSLGMGNEGVTRNWFFTYPGQLPWSYVSRQEFLLKRKKNVQRQYEEAKKQTQEAIDHWDRFKKEKEKEYANDPAKMANFMSGYYHPGLAEAKAKQPKILAQYEAALEKIDRQLSDPVSELSKNAIVIRSSNNALEYDFTDKMQPFAQLLIKPNPAYFKKGLAPSTPQMISVSIKFDPKDPRSERFASEIEKLLNLEYIQSFIGKAAPPKPNISTSTEKLTSDPISDKRSSTAAIQNSSKPNTKKETVAKPLTPQGPLARNGSFLSGTLSAPTGVPVTIGYDGGVDLAITPEKAAGMLYSTTPIKFSTAIKDSQPYSVVLKKIAGNMKGVIYRGSGKAPGGVNDIRIGVDYKYELLSRSSDDRVFSNFYETAGAAVGGMGSEEGRYVTFVSWTKGFAGNDGKFRQVFWRDRNTGITKLISTSPGGLLADADCTSPGISADGKMVVFESKAANLVAGDNNGKKDIFLWRANTGTVELVSRAAGGGFADGDSYDAMISGNGNAVVFTSGASNLHLTPKGRSRYNIFLRDIQTDKTEILSLDPMAKTGTDAVKASISFDGSRVTFCSSSSALVANDNNNLWDIFLWERNKPGLRRISLTHDGKERLQGDESASRQVASSISGNGRYVVYTTTAPNMVPGDNSKYQDVFVYDIETGKLQVASFSGDGQPGNNDSPIEQGERIAISFDGTWVAFATKASNLGTQSSNVVLYNTQTGKKQIVTDTRGSYVGRPAISYSGSYVIFGKSEALDQRSGVAFGDGGGGIFAHFTGNGPCRDGKD